MHLIPMGSVEGNPPLQRLQLVVGALTHTYDKVIVVADSLDDWPYDHVRPDIAAIVCGPDTTEAMRTEVYDAALVRGAHSALIVRFAGDLDDTAAERKAPPPDRRRPSTMLRQPRSAFRSARSPLRRRRAGCRRRAMRRGSS